MFIYASFLSMIFACIFREIWQSTIVKRDRPRFVHLGKATEMGPSPERKIQIMPKIWNKIKETFYENGRHQTHSNSGPDRDELLANHESGNANGQKLQEPPRENHNADSPRGTIEKERLGRALKRHMRNIEQFLHLESDTMTQLVNMCTRVHLSLDLNEVLTVITDQAVAVTRSEAIRTFLMDEEADTLEVVVPDAQGGPPVVSQRYERGRGIAGWAADSDALVMVADVSRDARFDAKVDAAAGVFVRSVLAVPLRVKNQCIGVMELINKNGREGFSEEDALLISFFADQAASALHNARVHGQLEARLDQSNRSRKQLVEEEKYRALEELSAGVSHDFKNLLNAILGFSEIVFLDIEDETARKDVMEIISATNTAIQLVDQIHTFSRRHDQQKIRVGIHHLVTRSLKQFQAGLTKSVDIRRDFLSHGEWLMADASQLHQALMNLFENAADALPEEAGTIRIAVDRVTVAADDAAHEGVDPGPYVEIIVRDNGQGIEADVMEQMFEPYFTTKARGVGTGLGLPLVRGVVQSHGGAVSVDSTPGKGTAVRLLLPALVEDRQAAVDAYEGLPRGTESILLVDDEALVCLAVEKMLKHLGYKVVTSDSAEDALKTYRQQAEHLDLVITDWSLPGIRGDRLAAMMLEIRSSARIIVYSAYAGNLKEEIRMSEGIRDVLRKPVDIRELALKVRKALDG